MSKAGQGNTYLALEKLKMSGEVGKSAGKHPHDAVICFNEAAAVIDCEEAFFDLFAVDDAQALFDNFYAFMPEFQPDGRISRTFFKNIVKDAFVNDAGPVKFSWLFKRADGKYFQADVSLSKCSKPDGNFIICHIKSSFNENIHPGSQEAARDIGEEVAALLNHAPGVIFFIDEHLNIPECNQNAMEAFSIKEKTDFAKKFFRDFAPKFQNSIRSDDLMRIQIQRAKSLGSTQFSWNVKRGYEEIPGSIRLVSTTYQGRPCCVAYLSEFEPDREVYFDEPLENNLLGERMWSLLDGMPFVWQFLESDLTCIDCNLAAVRMFDFKDKQEFINRSKETNPPNQPCGTTSAEKAGMHIRRAMEKGLACFEWMHQKPDGTPIPCEVTLMRVGIKDRFILAAFIRDLREHIALKALQSSEDSRMRIIMDSIPAVCTFWGEDRKLILCNRSAAELFGLSSPQEYLDRFAELSPKIQPCGTDSMQKALAYVEEAFGTGYCKFDWMHQKPDGTLIPSEITLTRVRWQNGYGLVGFTSDMRETLAKAEQQKQEEEKITIMLDNLPSVVATFWDANLNMVNCNQAAADLFGTKDKQEYINRFHELSPEFQSDGSLSADKAAKKLRDAFATGREVFEWMHRDVHGKPIPAEITLVRVNWRDGHALMGYCRDLREEFAIREERRLNDQRLQAVLDNVPACLNFWDAGGNLLYCNKHAIEMLGLEDAEDVAREFLNRYPERQPDGRDSMEASAEAVKVALEKGSYSISWVMLDADGGEIPTICNLYRVKWGDDFAVFEYLNDLREQQKLMKEQQENQERLLSIIDNVPAAIYICDENHRVLTHNAAMNKILGVDSGTDFNDASIYSFYPEFQSNGQNSRQMADEMLAKAFAEGSVSFAFDVISAEGDLLPIDCTITRIPWGDSVACLVFCHDLREQRSYEDRLRLILDNVPLASNFRDEDFALVDSNQAARDLFGVSSTEEYARRILELSPEYQPCGALSAEIGKEYIAAALRDGKITFNWMSQKTDGTPIPTEVTLVRVLWRGRTMVCTFLRDMRESIKYEQEQIAARERVMAMINASPLMCYVCDTDYNVLDCNDVSPKLMGMESKQEFIDNFRLLHPRKQPDGRTSVTAAADYLGRALADGSNTFNWWFRKPDKELLPVESSATRVELDGKHLLVVYSRDLRESMKYEQEQIASRERMLAMINASPMMCFICDDEFKLLDCNDRALEIFDADDKERFISNFIDVYPTYQPDGRNSIEALTEYLGLGFADGNVSFEWYFVKADGEALPVEVSATRTELHDSQYLIVYCRDLRDHYKYLEEQRVLQERMDAMINSSPLACIFLGHDSTLLDCNIPTLKLFGVKSKQDFFDNFMRFNPVRQPDGQSSDEKLREYVGLTFEQGSASLEWLHFTSKGEELPVEMNAQKVTLQDRDYAIVYLRDLRESIKFREERRIARERIVAMLDASPLACSILDHEFNILICNESVVELFELKDKDEYISKFLQLHPETQPDGRNSLEKLKENVARAFTAGSGMMTFEWMFQTLAGDLVPSEMTLKPVTLDDHNLMIAYIQDLRHIKQAALAAEALEKLAYTDSLTGANNRRYFTDVAEREFNNSMAESSPFSLIMLDIDDFKMINDNFGHVVGDGVLKILVSRIRHILRKNVVVARYGGEEFVIMMPNIPEEGAERTAWRIMKNIEGSKFLVEGVKVPVTVSMGIAGRTDADDNLTAVIVKADKALYEAKKRGKNTVVQYDESMQHKFSDGGTKK